MKFKDIVNIKEAFCCDLCKSYEYDLPYQIDKQLLESVFGFMDNPKHDISFEDILRANMLFQITKSENIKIELKPNSRYIKLCVDNNDPNLKPNLDKLLAAWIEDKLNIEIEL